MEAGYKAIANSGLFFVIAGIVILFVIGQSVVLLLMALKRNKHVGLTKTQIMKAVKSAAMMAILPSIATATGVFALAPILGIPIPWTRLSIIGALQVELAAASIGSEAAGMPSFTGNFTGIAFASAVWAMTFMTMWHLLGTAVSLKSVRKVVEKGTKQDKQWRNILTNSIMVGMLSIFFMRPAISGGDDLVTLLASCMIMLAIMVLMKFHKKLECLKEFAMPISMIGSMVVIVLYSM